MICSLEAETAVMVAVEVPVEVSVAVEMPAVEAADTKAEMVVT